MPVSLAMDILLRRRHLLLPPLPRHDTLTLSHTLPPSTLACTPASPSWGGRRDAQVVTWPPRPLRAAFLALLGGANAPRRTVLGCHCHLAHTLSTAHHHLVLLFVSPSSHANLAHTFSNSTLLSTGVLITVSGGNMG
ncbi:hypothetical protein CVT26_004331 [Gymnopilus dilepis]|uniref:Uncharacterized protein n=1 Tax=Gymnopilus dilepis TaxID=231916 RepID=A0A409YMT0_9AGAR|nr:hypothetical protein CVT26_004331 [Gymnopilus dilepis]